jgi:hypothetical protein
VAAIRIADWRATRLRVRPTVNRGAKLRRYAAMSKASGQGKLPKAHLRLIAAGVPNNTHETNHEETQPHCYALTDRSDPGGPLHYETFVADPIPMNVAGLLREPGAASKATASEGGGCNHRWRAARRRLHTRTRQTRPAWRRVHSQ